MQRGRNDRDFVKQALPLRLPAHRWVNWRGRPPRTFGTAAHAPREETLAPSDGGRSLPPLRAQVSYSRGGRTSLVDNTPSASVTCASRTFTASPQPAPKQPEKSPSLKTAVARPGAVVRLVSSRW